MNTKFVFSAALVANMAFPLASYAHEKGDFIVRVGAGVVSPSQETSADIVIAAPPLPNSQVSSLSSDTQLAATISYMLTDHIGIEGTLSLPFEMEAQLAGGVPLVTGSPDIGSIKYLPEIVSLQYYPMSPEAKFQPYVGVGVNYTMFFDGETSNALNTSPAGQSSLSVDDSIGLAAQIGADFMINDSWLVNAAVWYVDAETDAEITTTNIGVIDVEEIKIDPYVFAFTIGRKF